MPRWVNILVQIAAFCTVNTTLFAASVPAKYKGQIIVGMFVFSSVTAIIAHSYNPDGTPASQPYQPKLADKN